MNIYMKRAMIEERGVTLIELLVVISVIGILVVALGFSYQGWMTGNRVESTIKQIYSDMMEARLQAMTRDADAPVGMPVVYFADFPAGMPQVYRIFQDSNINLIPEPGVGDNILASFPKTIQYTLTRGWANATDAVRFDVRGTIQTPDVLGNTICIDNVQNPDLINIERDYDCIVISQTRIKIGKLNAAGLGGVCVAANCQTK